MTEQEKYYAAKNQRREVWRRRSSWIKNHWFDPIEWLGMGLGIAILVALVIIPMSIIMGCLFFWISDLDAKLLRKAQNNPCTHEARIFTVTNNVIHDIPCKEIHLGYATNPFSGSATNYIEIPYDDIMWINNTSK